MTNLEERVLIYTALAVVCSFAMVFIGLWAGALTFIQIAAVIEALYWFGLPKLNGFKHRQHRILFNGQ
jgi:hypothetical protein